MEWHVVHSKKRDKLSGTTEVVSRGFGRYDYMFTESLTNKILITSEDKNNINNQSLKK